MPQCYIPNAAHQNWLSTFRTNASRLGKRPFVDFMRSVRIIYANISYRPVNGLDRENGFTTLLLVAVVTSIARYEKTVVQNIQLRLPRSIGRVNFGPGGPANDLLSPSHRLLHFRRA